MKLILPILLAFSIVPSAHATPNQNEMVNRVCSYMVGIPYASDNFTDEEWERFVYCQYLLNE